MRARQTAFLIFFFLAQPAVAASVDLQAVNDAQWSREPRDKTISPLLIKAQVLLARARFSPGEIDGRSGDNLKKAAEAFAAEQGLSGPAGEITQELWGKLASTSAGPVVVEYTLTDSDLKGPFAERIPDKMEAMKDLPALSYTGPVEKLAEKFHMSEELLKALNGGRKFENAGAKIVVANVAAGDLPQRVSKIEVDKTRQVLKALGQNGKLIAFYPATAGSTEKPAPNGRLKITGVKKNPTYRYNPEYKFRGVRTDQPFTINPGPNNPVGVVWIGLSAEGYGIHGTPEPSKVGKSQSHGCVRLTNWDALQLASAVKKGIPVEFTGDEKAAQHSAKPARAKARRRR